MPSRLQVDEQPRELSIVGPHGEPDCEQDSSNRCQHATGARTAVLSANVGVITNRVVGFPEGQVWLIKEVTTENT